ncbi:calcineurin-like phosphoesterase C-terminal domain-containing protein [Sphingopyxis indica]|uniref:calcineurin-like phosphoesterase C-terminal domain-containing protein n=1 Tax=Sphingopyxis indica TaxID=436663 RepID=UPI001BAFD060|nr:calcineurin-like phosphoesterase family protein [Sphingopyxis indica]
MKKWGALLAAIAGGAIAGPAFAREPYFATIDVVRGSAPPAGTAAGKVFDDANRNGRLDDGEAGVPGVKVSNGRDVVQTAADGSYSLAARDDMSVFVIQPSGWQVPTNRDFIPQFAYQHKPAGSPKRLRFGGLPPTGPLPAAINFPLAPSETGDDFRCAILGDVQATSNMEVGYARDTIVRELENLNDRPACIFALGDLVGDDLGLIPRLADVLGAARIPQWWVQGNHDYDSDADRDADSSDSWRREYGPVTYAFEIGRVLFIGLDNIVYPCGRVDYEAFSRDFCGEDPRKTYNGRFTDDQMRFVENLVKATDPGKLIVLGHHIPLVGFDNREQWQHQTDNAAELYRILKGRKALDLSGHSHTLENLASGDSFAGWKQSVGVDTIPFRHVVAGAVAGDWWGGDFDIAGIPMSLQGDGSPRGYIDMAVRGTDYDLDYRAAGQPVDKAMWLSMSTPEFRDWARVLLAWRNSPAQKRGEVPPLSIQDLPDVRLLTPQDIAGGSWLTANVWMGDSDTVVTVSIDGGAAQRMERTQQARGEPSHVGADFADPFALQHQLAVTRTAIASRSGDPLAQGYIQGRQDRFAPAPPRPQGSAADHSSHLWRFRIPGGLRDGTHSAQVHVERPQGSSTSETMIFETRATRPQPTFRFDAWNAFEDGPRVPEN